MFLSTFNFNSLIPIAILLFVSVIIPIILSLLGLKFIPVLVLEIICGIIIGNIPFIYEQFVTEGTLHFNNLIEGIYTIGMAVLLFLSGLDIDYSVLKPSHKNNCKTLPTFKISWILIALVILVSFGLSFTYFNDFVDANIETRVTGVILLTIIFSSSFASIIIPLIHEDHLAQTTIGKIIATYSSIAEFISIVSLSIFMIVLHVAHDAKPWLLLLVIGILIVVYIIRKFFFKDKIRSMFGGIVHLDVRHVLLVLLVLVIITQFAGAEFILGAFLAGAIIKATGIKKEVEEKFLSIGYGIFAPMFYILVGVKVGLSVPFDEFFTLSNILLVLRVFAMLVIAKLPFLILAKWFKFSTAIESAFVVTTTIIVGLTCEHFGVFTEELMCAIIVASTLTCVIPPIILFLNKKFGYSKEEHNDKIINPDEVECEH